MNIDRSKPVLINGAGIAGLTTALVLAEKGYPVHIFEKESHFETTGAGIQLSPNAVHILDSLGVGTKNPGACYRT